MRLVAFPGRAGIIPDNFPDGEPIPERKRGQGYELLKRTCPCCGTVFWTWAINRTFCSKKCAKSAYEAEHSKSINAKRRKRRAIDNGVDIAESVTSGNPDLCDDANMASRLRVPYGRYIAEFKGNPDKILRRQVSLISAPEIVHGQREFKVPGITD